MINGVIPGKDEDFMSDNMKKKLRESGKKIAKGLPEEDDDPIARGGSYEQPDWKEVGTIEDEDG